MDIYTVDGAAYTEAVISLQRRAVRQKTQVTGGLGL